MKRFESKLAAALLLVTGAVLATACVPEQVGPTLPTISDCRDAETCSNIAYNLVEQSYVEQAAPFFQRACELDPKHTCGAAGAYQRMHGTPAAALGFFSRGCSADDEQACMDGVREAADGKQMPAAAWMLKKLCETGKTQFCVQETLLGADKVPVDVVTRSLEELCTLRQQPLGCFDAGVLVEASDRPRAGALFEKACKMGSGVACLWQTTSQERAQFSADKIKGDIAKAPLTVRAALDACQAALRDQGMSPQDIGIAQGVVQFQNADPTKGAAILVSVRPRLDRTYVAAILRTPDGRQTTAAAQSAALEETFWQRLRVEGAKRGVVLVQEDDLDGASRRLREVMAQAKREF